MTSALGSHLESKREKYLKNVLARQNPTFWHALRIQFQNSQVPMALRLNRSLPGLRLPTARRSPPPHSRQAHPASLLESQPAHQDTQPQNTCRPSKYAHV